VNFDLRGRRLGAAVTPGRAAAGERDQACGMFSGFDADRRVRRGQRALLN